MRWALAILILLLIPTAVGQINGPREFTADYGFTDASEAGNITIISGGLNARLDAGQETWGFLDTVGMQVRGVDIVCHERFASGFSDPCIEGDFTLLVDDHSGVGVKWPRASGVFASDHTIGFLATSNGGDLNSLILNESLVAPSIGGRMVYDNVRAPDPTFLSGGARYAAMAVAVPLFEDSRILLQAAGNVIETFERNDGLIAFAGRTVTVPPFTADTGLLPFTEESTITFGEAQADAARQGISLQRIQDVQLLIQQASANPSERPAPTEQENPIFEALSEILDAALVRFPVGPNATTERVQEGLSIVLFDEMVIRNNGEGLDWQGQAAFQFQNGEIKGAQALYGVWYLQLPLWGWALWVVAIGVFIARAVVRPEKQHDRWDSKRWIGWLAGVLMGIMVFVMWDFEMRSVWGTSVFSTGNVGTAFWLTFGLQLATMSFVLGAVGWPISIIIKNGLLLAKQGSFMGLGKPVSLLVSYLLGATLFLAYLQLLIASVMSNIGG